MKAQVKSMMEYAFFEGKVVPSKNAHITIASHSLQYGTGCFGGMRGYLRGSKARLLRMRDHFDRLKNACKIFGMEIDLDFEVFKKSVSDLIAANHPDTDFYVRPFIYSDDEILTPRFHDVTFKLAIYMIPLGNYLDTSRGLRLMVSSYQKFPDASISTKTKATGSYLHAASARTQANKAGYDEALVMDHSWHIVEGSAENILVMYRGTAIMPPVGGDLLDGITMRSVVTFLGERGIPVRFEPIDRSMVYTCDELLLTGTAATVLFAESVDDRIITKTMGPVCMALRDDFTNLIEKKHPRSKEWITEFSV